MAKGDFLRPKLTTFPRFRLKRLGKDEFVQSHLQTVGKDESDVVQNLLVSCVIGGPVQSCPRKMNNYESVNHNHASTTRKADVKT